VPSRARSAVAPLYLLGCLVLGGSAQGVWQNMVLQLLGLGIIAWAAAEPSKEMLPGPAKRLLFLAIAAIAVVVLQQIPLPPSVWRHGVRAHLAQSYQLLGRPAPSLPISLTPYESLAALLCIIPPLAMFCAIVRLKAFRPSWLAASLLGGAVAGIILSALQVAGAGRTSAWYPYAETNLGLGVGFFANANHMADLLVIALPFVAAIAAAGRSRNIQRYSALLTVLVALALLLIAGTVLTRSLAGYLLAVPVIAGSALIVLPQWSRWRGWIALIAGLTVLLAAGALATSSVGSTKIGVKAVGSVQSRAVILQKTAKAISDHMPLGTGLGSFVRVYRLYESPQTVTNEYVIHAHNDYAELTLELGVPGVILMLLFLGWWARAVWAVWRNAEGGPFTRAASIATTVVLIHSLVDFPLRTAAISTCFAMFLALLADRRVPPRQDANDLRPIRHLVFT
jgi:O-antigen ligase